MAAASGLVHRTRKMQGVTIGYDPCGRSGQGSYLTAIGGRANVTGMLHQVPMRRRKSRRLYLAWRLVTAVVLSLVLPHAAGAQGGGDSRSVVILSAHSHVGAPRLPAGVAESIDLVLVAHLQRSGYTVARFSRAQAGSCATADYACIARAAKQDGAFVLDSDVQANDDGTGYLTFTLADSTNPDSIVQQSVALGTPNSGRALPKEVEKNAEQLTQAITELLKRVSSGSSTVHKVPGPRTDVPASGKLLKLEVEIEGRGHVTSVPGGIDCRDKCSSGFAVDGTGQSHVTLSAKPLLPASVVRWEGLPCTNSELADPFRCQLVIGKDERLRVSFERSTTRKLLTGVFWGLGLAGIVAGSVLLAVNGQSCDSPGKSCYWETRAPGGGAIAGGGALVIGGAFIYWLHL